jgi:hypothetical protein
MLTEDVALHADGGGKVPAVARPVNGRERVARLLSIGVSQLPRYGVRIEVSEVNGQPGALALDAEDRLVGVIALEVAEGRVQSVHAVVNPDKLQHFDRVGDLVALTRAARRRRPGAGETPGRPS